MNYEEGEQLEKMEAGYQIIADFHTKNDCYRAARVREKTHIIVHSTGCKGPAYIPRWQKWNTPNFQKCAHAFIDWNGIYQNLPWEYQGWLNGVKAGNDAAIAFEICEPPAKSDTPEMAADLYGKTLFLCVHLCRQYAIAPERVICHAEAHRIGLANNHADVAHWWGKPGTAWEAYSMERLRLDIADALGVREAFPYPAAVRTRTGGPISLWSVPGTNAAARRRVCYARYAQVLTVLGRSSLSGWFLARTEDGETGHADGQYLAKLPPEVSEEGDHDLRGGAEGVAL